MGVAAGYNPSTCRTHGRTSDRADSEEPNVIPLNVKVSAEFRKRFRERALNADLKLNELLVEALDAWERVNGLKK